MSIPGICTVTFSAGAPSRISIFLARCVTARNRSASRNTVFFETSGCGSVVVERYVLPHCHNEFVAAFSLGLSSLIRNSSTSIQGYGRYQIRGERSLALEIMIVPATASIPRLTMRSRRNCPHDQSWRTGKGISLRSKLFPRCRFRPDRNPLARERSSASPNY